MSGEARATLAREAAVLRPQGDHLATLQARHVAFNRRHLAVALQLHDVRTARETIGGVAVDVVTPRGGGNRRTLLCLHGGAFMWGRGAGALLEAVPVAATAGVRVLAVEHALALRRVFPAAVDDVLAVYAALIADRDPRSVGLYGCPAGGILTAQAIARMVADGAARSRCCAAPGSTCAATPPPPPHCSPASPTARTEAG